MRDAVKWMVLLAVISAAPSRASAYIMKKEVTRRVAAAVHSRLILKNRAGSVEVSTWDKDTVKVRADFKIRAPSRTEAEEIFRDTILEFRKGGADLFMEPEIPPLRQYGVFSFSRTVRTTVSVDYRVVIPDSMKLEIELVDGDIILEKIKSSYKLINKRGSVTVDSPSVSEGMIRVGRGNINISICQPEWMGKVYAECGSGNISIIFPERADLILEAQAVRGRVNFSFEGIEPLRGNEDSVWAIFGAGRGRIVAGTVRGDITVRDID